MSATCLCVQKSIRPTGGGALQTVFYVVEVCRAECSPSSDRFVRSGIIAILKWNIEFFAKQDKNK